MGGAAKVVLSHKQAAKKRQLETGFMTFPVRVTAVRSLATVATNLPSLHRMKYAVGLVPAFADASADRASQISRSARQLR
jgi:hypothetical protein